MTLEELIDSLNKAPSPAEKIWVEIINAYTTGYKDGFIKGKKVGEAPHRPPPS